jgi:CHAT domain-containing protein/tetratricopeptide (TPR) repeat protein
MRLRLLAILPLAALASPTAAGADEDPFAACRAGFEAAPEDRKAAACFSTAARKSKSWTRGEAEIDAMLATHPDNPGLLLARAHLAAYQSLPDAPDRYERAAASFANIGGHRGVAIANVNRSKMLTLRGRHDEAAVALEQGVAAAEKTGDDKLLAIMRSQLADQIMRSGGDLSRAYLLLRGVEEILFPDGDASSQMACVYNLGKVTGELGRWPEAVRYFERALELANQRDDAYSAATFRMNLVEVMVAAIEDAPRDDRADAAVEATREALAAAEAAGNELIAGKAHMLLGDLLLSEDAITHTQKCVDIARSSEAPEMLRACETRLAMHLVTTQPRRAEELTERAYDRARSLGVRRGIALAASTRAFVSRRAGPRDRAIEHALQTLREIELARDVQHDEDVRARYFSVWLTEYYKLVGFLLGAPTAQPPRADLETAFVIAERMRGRALLEALDLVGATPAFARDTPGREQRDAVLDEIAAVQRQLVDGDDTGRDALLARLEKLERDESELRDAMARVDARFASIRRPHYATLASVQDALGPDQAMLSYLVAPWTDLFGYQRGGSWVIAVWRDGVHVAPLPERRAVADLVDGFTGLVQRREPLGDTPASSVGDALLTAAVDALPATVRRLVVVADGALHRLPFAALSYRGRALAERFELSSAPSATLWLRWSSGDIASSGRGYLAYADPTRSTSSKPGAATTRGAAFDGSHLAALPGARAEVKKMAAHLGASTTTRMGDDASERTLKNTDMSRYALLHFASHAIVDDFVPRRTGVVLAPGAAIEDGLLQLHEVVDLGLDGQVVVLSSCESASGAFVGGEGVNGLSRAFLQAGAGVVVANLWRVRDDESAQLFDEFYRQLSRGKSVAGALAATQRRLARAGVPPVAWAGVVVIGNGDTVLFPDAQSGSRGRFRYWYAGLIALLLLGFLVCASRAS